MGLWPGLNIIVVGLAMVTRVIMPRPQQHIGGVIVSTGVIKRYFDPLGMARMTQLDEVNIEAMGRVVRVPVHVLYCTLTCILCTVLLVHFARQIIRIPLCGEMPGGVAACIYIIRMLVECV